MCEQKKVFKKIKVKGRVNGYDLELAEAQMNDYIALRREVDSVRESVNTMKLEQARQGGMIEAIFNRINSPVEQERKDGIVWHEIRNAVKSWKGWAFIIFFLFSVALAGDKILQLTGWLPTGM